MLGGAGGGAGKIIAGVALVALALMNPFGAAAIGTFGATPIPVASFIGAIGASLILGGVAQLLSPTPQIAQIGPASMNPGGGRNTTSEGTEMDPQESYSFSGIQNTSRQGTPVPVVYGETIVGSVVISAGIDVDTI